MAFIRYAAQERARAREGRAYRLYMSEAARLLVGFEKGYMALLDEPPAPIDVDATINEVAESCGLEVIG